MSSFNRVIVMGNLGQDPVLRNTASGAAVVTLSVATTHVYTPADGQRQETTEWHRIVVWNKQAENCARYLSKGRPVLVEGRLQTRSWDDKNGQKRYTTEIIANTVTFVGSRDKAGQFEEPPLPEPEPTATSSFGGPETPGVDDIPF